MARYNYAYSGYQYQHDQYSFFGFRIFRYNHGRIEELGSIQWQGDPGNSYWYAGDIKPAHTSNPESVVLFGNLLVRLVGEQGCYSNPEYVLQQMQEKGWSEVIYDPRFSTFIKLEEVPPATFHKYGDDQHCVAVVAESIEEARKCIHIEMDKYGYKEAKVNWVAGGEVVNFLYAGTRIEKTTAQEMLESPFWYKKPEDRNDY